MITMDTLPLKKEPHGDRRIGRRVPFYATAQVADAASALPGRATGHGRLVFSFGRCPGADVRLVLERAGPGLAYPVSADRLRRRGLRIGPVEPGRPDVVARSVHRLGPAGGVLHRTDPSARGDAASPGVACDAASPRSCCDSSPVFALRAFIPWA